MTFSVIATEPDGSRWVLFDEALAVYDEVAIAIDAMALKGIYPAYYYRAILDMKPSVAPAIESCGCDRTSIHDCVCPQCRARYIAARPWIYHEQPKVKNE